MEQMVIVLSLEKLLIGFQSVIAIPFCIETEKIVNPQVSMNLPS